MLASELLMVGTVWGFSGFIKQASNLSACKRD